MTLAMLVSSWDQREEASFPIGVPSASCLPFDFLFSPGQEDLLAEGVSRVPVASCLLLFVSMKEKRREQYLTQ